MTENNIDQKLNIKDVCIIIDFDKTITLGHVDGKSVPSIISILRSEKHLSDEYTKAAYELEAKYKPIEMDHNLPFEMRYKAMNSWWTEHLDLLIESGLNIEHLKEASKSKQIVIRSGFEELANFANENRIPVIIFSASGIGYEPIELVLKRDSLMYNNIKIVSNRFIWDSDGNATGRGLPLVHSLSKTGDMLKNTYAWEMIKDKKSCILIGDALHDLSMSDGIDFVKVITVGVLNEVTDERLELYKSRFDLVLLGDEKHDESLVKVIDLIEQG